MSEESTTLDLVQLTRRFFEAANRCDLDVAERFYASDAVWEAVSLGTSFEGVAAIRGFWEDWIGAYEEFEIEMEKAFDLGNGVVFVVTRLGGRPAGGPGGAPITRRRPLVFRWMGGAIQEVTAPSSGIDVARATAERLAEERG